jgi:ParB family chromosome partitioning protein
MNNLPRNPLGKGLAALLGDGSLTQAQVAQQTLPIEQISPGNLQPRKVFDEEQLQNLAESIQRKGILQPILVRQISENSFHIIAGERRWRAAKMVKLEQIPVVVLRCSNRDALEIGLIENLQRHDLNAVEEAEAILRLQEEFALTQEQISAGIGKSRSHVANILRLNDLSPKIKEMLRNNQISAGHARSLLSAENAEALAEEIVRDNLSVRALEQKVKKNKAPSKKAQAGDEYSNSPSDADIQAISRQLADSLNMKVELKVNGQSGSLTVKFQKLEQLDMLIGLLQKDF